MDCLHPTISQRLTPLVISISAERRRAVLRIAQQASCWQEFLDALKQGDFRLPNDAQASLANIKPRVGRRN
jgi:hypothetical protein